ncbi:MAG: hypothetical protein QOI47_1784 [Actinomycetota bacterium]|nr:hypothetical protein [Actinomycetota bacterium]
MRLLTALLLLNVVAGVTVVGAGVAGAASDAELPTNLHGSVETQALTAGNGALALFVDPGTAYAYSTFDRDDYGGGATSYTMTARGANLNLGTIALAVIWAAPDCANHNAPCVLSGGLGSPNTGLSEAAGFPLYAEALYPPPPKENGPSRERVYKCVVNKDAPGAAPTSGAAQDVCKQSDGIPLSSWAEAPGDELRSTGFSRVAGFNTPVVAVGTSESHSDVRYIGKGALQSKGTSAIHDISILGGQVRIESSSVAATITSSTDGQPKREASCLFGGVTIAGQKMSVTDISNGGAQSALDAVAKATGYQVQILPPSPVVLKQDEGGKQVASCHGVQVFITDLHQGSPVPACAPQVDPSVPSCVPAAGNRVELTFGSINVQQSVNNIASALGGLTGGLTDVGAFGTPAYAPGTASLASSSTPSSSGSEVALSPAPSSSASASNGQASNAPLHAQLASTDGQRNLGAIGSLTALATVGLLGGVLLLIGVVNALGSGGRFRFPGLGP